MIGLAPAAPIEHVIALGAHCDDIAIGCGGALQALCAAHPGIAVHAVILTGGGTDREAEERAALQQLCGDADLRVDVLDLPDGRVPVHFERAKDAVIGARAAAAPDLVFAPYAGDAHQDHRTVAEIAPTVFRDQLILGYEILKWESDLPRPSAYHPLTDEQLAGKLRVLHECYPSQRGHDWYDAECFSGLARVRGAQCHARYAEAFVADKFTVTF